MLHITFINISCEIGLKWCRTHRSMSQYGITRQQYIDTPNWHLKMLWYMFMPNHQAQQWYFLYNTLFVVAANINSWSRQVHKAWKTLLYCCSWVTKQTNKISLQMGELLLIWKVYINLCGWQIYHISFIDLLNISCQIGQFLTQHAGIWHINP